jgi:hypothetical protein
MALRATCKFPPGPRSFLRQTDNGPGDEMDGGSKSALYREVNALTRVMLERFDSEEAAHFLCECEDTDCSRRLELRGAEFDDACRLAGFLVSPECVRDSEVLHRDERYAVVVVPRVGDARRASGGTC